MKLDAVKEWLRQLDEVQVCELLDISSEDLIDRCEDLIILRRKYIEREMEILDSSTEEPEELDFNYDEA